ncbi:MAG: nucleoside hydrolase [Myxococcota bacterium]
MRDAIPVVFDMETQDPDDFLTLLLLLGHPAVDLRAVTITPGSRWQVGLIRKALEWFAVTIPVGARKLDHPKECVSHWHRKAYGAFEPSSDAEPAVDVLRRLCDETTTLITGAPVHNLGAACASTDFRLGRWVAQGGFAGHGVVPPELQLPKFAGRRTMATFNLGGAPKAALAALAHPGIRERRFVSKNVCHRVVYDETLHQQIGALVEESLALARIWQGMETYLQRRRHHSRNEAIDAPHVLLVGDGEKREASIADALARAEELDHDLVDVGAPTEVPVCRLVPKTASSEPVGKKLHDPLAACCAIDPTVGTWAEVELFREKGKWGSRLAPGSGCEILIDYDHDAFVQVFTAR